MPIEIWYSLHRNRPICCHNTSTNSEAYKVTLFFISYSFFSLFADLKYYLYNCDKLDVQSLSYVLCGRSKSIKTNHPMVSFVTHTNWFSFKYCWIQHLNHLFRANSKYNGELNLDNIVQCYRNNQISYYRIVAFIVDMNAGTKYFIGTPFTIVEDSLINTIVVDDGKPAEQLDISSIIHSTYSTISIKNNIPHHLLILNPPVLISSLQQIKHAYEQQQLLQPAQSNPNHHRYLGRQIQVWFQSNQRYYYGTVVRWLGEGLFTVRYKNGQQEDVELLEKHQTNNSSDEDRWNFI
eukprot:TRINITY_DN5940_c0_g1_i1.p1 TRINITY_DN5940_c0_g1~~TRINITY_DN5940_c0_g1_i1.p1  ORF type:complete len:293 (+),score=30.39 TRINITY_DN5940_c0_g1_i1:784-1662(+)